MNNPPVAQNLRVELGKVTVTSRARLAEAEFPYLSKSQSSEQLGSLACQNTQESDYIGSAAEALEKLEFCC
jgi:hypothetical protein